MRGLTRRDLDLQDFVALARAFREQRPRLVLHCAAISRSPACQSHPQLARQINVEATARLAELAADIPLVFFSSDLVFDGRKGRYAEDDPVNPLGVYAETKAAAEQVVLANPRHLVIRTSLNGGTSPTSDRGFNEEMRRAWQEGRTLRLFSDEFRCPTPAIITAAAVWELVNQRQTGLFHLAGSERLSRLAIGELLAARWPQLKPRIEAASRAEYRGAPRPADTSLDCQKAQQLLSFRLPGLSEWLRDHPDEPF